MLDGESLLVPLYVTKAGWIGGGSEEVLCTVMSEGGSIGMPRLRRALGMGRNGKRSSTALRRLGVSSSGRGVIVESSIMSS